MRNIISAVAVLTVAGALSACAGAPKTYNQTSLISDPQSYYAYGASERDLKLVVVGNPFSQPANQVGEALASEMDAAQVGPGTHFTPNPGPSAREGFRVVLAFNGADGEHELCGAAADAKTLPPSSNVHVTAALCEQGRLLTSVEGQVADVSGVNDPRVSSLMKQVALGLFPNSAVWKN